MKMSKVFAVLPFLYQIGCKLCNQRKRVVPLIFCAAMMSACIPAIHAAKADSAARPVLANEQVLVNGAKAAQIGAVTYSASGEGYEIDASSARVRVRNGDSISFEGTISAPEGETISWVRVDVYDADAEEPYTVGAEHYRADGLRVQQFDLASVPALTIGETDDEADYALVEGKKYIVMLSAGISGGDGFADMDADVEDDQGPAILVDVKLNPENCDHPHSDFVYILHPSGETRKYSYGDPLTHQVEPLYERYCGLCDIFLMNIWGQGKPEEHTFGSDGVCLACGYYYGEDVEDEAAEDSAETLEMTLEDVVEETNPDRQVKVLASWENEKLAIGDALTLTAELTGYDGLSYTIFWQCDKGSGFEDIDIADGHASIQFVVDEENKLWRWRAGVSIDVEIQTAQEGSPIVQETEAVEENGADALNTEEAAEPEEA